MYCLAGGLVGAVPAAITGYIDYGLVKSPGASRVARFHLILNSIVSAMMAVSIIWRYQETPPNYSLGPVVISVLGFVLVGLSGWLGGELVSTYGISVHGLPDDRDHRDES